MRKRPRCGIDTCRLDGQYQRSIRAGHTRDDQLVEEHELQRWDGQLLAQHVARATLRDRLYSYAFEPALPSKTLPYEFMKQWMTHIFRSSSSVRHQ